MIISKIVGAYYVANLVIRQQSLFNVSPVFLDFPITACSCRALSPYFLFMGGVDELIFDIL